MKGILLCAILTTTFFFGCKKDEATSPSQDQFADKLTLGAGMSGFTIVGESATFARLSGSAMVFWRLESAADMGGSSVKIRIDKQGTGGYAPFDSVTYQNPQSYGHIMLSSFTMSSAGSFRASGVLLSNGKSVASKDFSVN